jgi:hypothetical protein
MSCLTCRYVPCAVVELTATSRHSGQDLLLSFFAHRAYICYEIALK